MGVRRCGVDVTLVRQTHGDAERVALGGVDLLHTPIDRVAIRLCLLEILERMLPPVPIIQGHDITIGFSVPRQLDLRGIRTDPISILVIGPVLRHIDVERVQPQLRVILMDVMVRCLARLGDLSGTHVDVVVRMSVLLDGSLCHITGRRSHLNQRLNALILT